MGLTENDKAIHEAAKIYAGFTTAELADYKLFLVKYTAFIEGAKFVKTLDK
jgi:hypothetical protein